MIAVDTSALMAILLDEPEADTSATAILRETEIVISAGTMAEALSVAHHRGVGSEMTRLIDGLGFAVVDVSAASAQRVADVHRRWGKGRHPAGLNFGDCFAYEVATQYGCPLLFVGEDFGKTDLRRAIG